MAQAKVKKKFFDVEIPAVKRETKAQAYEISELNGRFIGIDLTRELKGKALVLNSKISVENNVAIAKPVEAKIMPYFLKRVVRKGTNYVEDSFSAECKNAKVKIKPFFVTRRKVPRSIRNALRIKAKEEILSYAKDKNIDKIFDDLISGKLQRELSMKLKKIYPLSFCEIRIFKLEKELKN